jgi:hypothetical protein
MQEEVAWHFIGCIICCTNKLNNMKQGIYHPLLVPTRHWEIISMDFVEGLQTTGKRHDYLFVVVDKFGKILLAWFHACTCPS